MTTYFSVPGLLVSVPISGRGGFGGECGHVLVPYQSIVGTEGMRPQCNCGRTGDLESVCSLTAIEKTLLPYFLPKYPVHELARVLSEYGEERFARRIAEAVARERAREPVTTTLRLSAIVKDAIPAAARRTGGNPAKRTFQALRIEVNDELGALRRAVPAALDAIAVGGRIVVLSYQSLEDRIVKRALVERSVDTTPPGLPVLLAASRPEFRLLTSGAERPAEAEVVANPRAASARLRAAQRERAAA